MRYSICHVTPSISSCTSTTHTRPLLLTCTWIVLPPSAAGVDAGGGVDTVGCGACCCCWWIEHVERPAAYPNLMLYATDAGCCCTILLSRNNNRLPIITLSILIVYMPAPLGIMLGPMLEWPLDTTHSPTSCHPTASSPAASHSRSHDYGVCSASSLL